MGTADYDREELDFRDYRKVLAMEAKRVRRAVLVYRVRLWLLIAAIVSVPATLMAWMIWSMR
jgi:hypothetical protein